jgi:hypothetical protein
MPRHFAFPRCRILRHQAERVKRRQYFLRSELKILWQYAKPWERALMTLALNCGFGKRELATLQSGEVVRRKGRRFIARHRQKTGVYAEWVLWPEAEAALEYLGRFNGGGPVVVTTTRGTTLAKGTPKGNENQIIKNHWDRLMERVKEDHPEFHRLPFKHLRKTGSTLLRRLRLPDAAELTSMYLSHGDGTAAGDELLPVYASRPWGKLHSALLRLRRKLLPVLASVPDPWKYERGAISPATVAKVKELRVGGKTQKEIAETVGLHVVTVGKICRKMAPKNPAEGDKDSQVV